MRTCSLLLTCLSLHFLACSDDPAKAEVPDGAPPVQQESFSVSLGPIQAGTTVFSSKSTGELIESIAADAEGNATLNGFPGGMISFQTSETSVVSFLGIRSGEVLRWLDKSNETRSEDTLWFAPESVDGATDYRGSACGYPALTTKEEGEHLGDLEFIFSEECLAQETVSFSAIAYDNDFLLAYAQLDAPSTAIPDEELSLEWKTDFLETPIEFTSDLASQIVAYNTLVDGSYNIRMPSHDVVKSSPVLITPPNMELAWTELTRFPNTPGWQSVAGALPTDESHWLEVTKDVVVTHTAEAPLSMIWLPTQKGDLQTGNYTWQDSAGYHSWILIAPTSVGGATYPENPSGAAIPAEVPIFAFMDIKVNDYDDVEGYTMAMVANRASWIFGADDSFLAGGGRLSSSTLFSYSSTENRQLPDVLDNLSKHSRHVGRVAPLAAAARPLSL